MKPLKTRQDVRQWGDETLAWEIYENEIDVATLPNDVLREIIEHIKPTQSKLNEEYITGDPLCYPPDWYDSYVFPLDCAINKCQDELDERKRAEDSEEDSEW